MSDACAWGRNLFSQEIDGQAFRKGFQDAEVPEIEDDFQWSWYLARSSTVDQVLDGIGAELGLAKVIYGPGGGNVDYVLEEIWTHSDGTECM